MPGCILSFWVSTRAARTKGAQAMHPSCGRPNPALDTSSWDSAQYRGAAQAALQNPPEVLVLALQQEHIPGKGWQFPRSDRIHRQLRPAHAALSQCDISASHPAGPGVGDRDAGSTVGPCKKRRVPCRAGAHVHVWHMWVLDTPLPARAIACPRRG